MSNYESRLPPILNSVDSTIVGQQNASNQMRQSRILPEEGHAPNHPPAHPVIARGDSPRGNMPEDGRERHIEWQYDGTDIHDGHTLRTRIIHWSSAINRWVEPYVKFENDDSVKFELENPDKIILHQPNTYSSVIVMDL